MLTRRLIGAWLLSSAVIAPAAAAPNELDDLHFLVGRWASGEGVVAETRQRSTGTSVFTEEAGGGALLRRDHTELSDASGQRAGGFDQVMLITRDGGAYHATYSDGAHVIEYRSATIVPGVSVTFLTEASPDRPSFRLSYRLRDPETLAVTFEMARPGQATFAPIATGTLKRSS